jgi:probable HAF family extracellular repeat protein
MTMYDIMVLQGPNNTWASAEGVSSAGDYVAGESFNRQLAVPVGVIWRAGRIEFSRDNLRLWAVNSRGVAVGVDSSRDHAPVVPVLVQADPREVQDLTAAVGSGSVPTDINDTGGVCGENHNTGKSFRYVSQVHPVLQTIDPLPGMTGTWARAINDKHQVVGDSTSASIPMRAFLYDDGTSKDLGTGHAMDLNNDGLICGLVGDPAPGEPNYLPALWDANNPSRPAEEIPLPAGFTGGEAWGINNSGTVVGECQTKSGMRSAFISYPSDDVKRRKGQDLNELITDRDWQLERALSINDSGQIIGYGTYLGQERTDFLLEPERHGPPPVLPFAEIVIPESFEVVVGRALVGGSGWVISLKGGRPPQPVPPPEQAWLGLTAAKRDALMGLVLDELARSIPDAATRERVQTELLDGVQASLARLRQSVAARPAARPELAPLTKAELFEHLARRFVGPRGQAR